MFAVLFPMIFGPVLHASDSYSYTGEDSESADNLNYNRARYYDPETGTFLCKDPLGIQGGVNAYLYASSNPINGLDPLGLDTIGEHYLGLPESWRKTMLGGAYITFGASITVATLGAGWQLGAAATTAGGGTLAGTVLIGAPTVATQVIGDPALASIGVLGVGGISLASGTPLAPVVDGFTAPQGFSGVYDTTTGAIGLSPSVYVEPGATVPEGFVNARGGHLDVSDALGGDPDNQVGFAVVLQEDGTANVTWTSRTLNSSYPDAQVPVEFQQPILDTVQDQTGLTINGATPFSDPLTQAFDLTAAGALGNLAVGGVLIDKAATLVGTSLSDIKGATFDPVSKQIVFLGSNNVNATTAINMDYFYTAVQAVYGSAQPPFVTLDPPATPYTQWTNFSSPSSGTTWLTGQTGGFILRYNPLWDGQDVTTNNTPASVAIRVRASWSGTQYDFTLNFAAQELNGQGVGLTIVSGGRYAVNLVYTGTVDNAGNLPQGIQFYSAPFTSGNLWGSLQLTSTSQDSYWPVELTNNTGQSFIVNSISVIPAKQHREYGGRIDGTKLGWVMYEADRVMKCLSVGKDNLTGAIYSSKTIGSGVGGSNAVPGYQNLLEISQANSDPGGNVRMWFEPNDMTLQRYVDPTSGQATVVFQSSTVELLTESYLQGLPQDPAAQTFATFFTNPTNYSKFAAMTFPVEDPTDPTGQNIIQAPIFALLQQAMQAVTLARFFRDNNIPLDKWWLNSYQPPTAYSLKSTPTAITQSTTGQPFFLIYGGVQIQKTNSYVPSTTAQAIGQAVTSARPADPTSSPDLQMQSWSAGTSQGTVNAVATSTATDTQDGNVSLAEPDVFFISPGALPLTLTRYYQSSWLGTSNLGPGWRDTRYTLQFSNPSWYDQTHLMKDGSGHAIATDSASDTRLRTGTIRLLDLKTGALLDFQSSLGLSYATDSLGNPFISITGLTASDVPTFTAGQNQTGATITQTTDANKSYVVTYPDGSWMEFDNNGNLLQTTDRHNYTQIYAYDASGRLSTITDSASQVLTLSYNATTSLLQSVTGPNVSGPNNQGVTYSYDTNGRLTQVVHNPSNVVIDQYTYNGENQLVDVTRANGVKPVTTTADTKGRSMGRKDSRGNSTTWSYSAKAANGSRVTDSFDPNSGLGTWEKGTDSSGRATYVKDSLNNFTMLGYNGTSPLPNSIQPPLPSDVQSAPSSRPPISITRNSIGLPTKISDPASPSAQPLTVGYTTANLPTHMTDAANRAVDIAYTPSNNPQRFRRYHNGNPVDTTIGYQNEFVHTVADPMGHTWTYDRDNLGRLTGITDPTGVHITYEYDNMGRLWKEHDPRLSSAIVHGYDALNRPISLTTPAGSTSYSYDPVTTNLTSSTNTTTDGQVTEVQYGYNNPTGDVTSTTTTYQLPASAGGGTQSVTSNYSYTAYGDLQTVTPPGAQPINYSYNSLGQLLGNSETNSGLTTGPLIVAANATSSVWTNQNSQSFTWGPPTSSVPVTGYNYAEDASTAMSVNSTGLTLSWNSISDGQHLFNVRAVDSGGHWSPQTTFNLWIDTTPPVISL